MEIKTKKHLYGWRVIVDGKETNLLIEKSDYPPKWGERQEWVVTLAHDRNRLLFTVYSKAEAITAVEEVMKACA